MEYVRISKRLISIIIIIIIIIIIKDQTRHPRKSPRTIRLRRVPRGQSKIIGKKEGKQKKNKINNRQIKLEIKETVYKKNYVSSKYLLICDLKPFTLWSVTIFSGHSFQILIVFLKKVLLNCPVR